MLSDICNVQGVKRVIYHLIESLCVAETVKKTHHTFLSLLTLAAICTHRVTGPIADSSSAVPVCPCVFSQRCSVTCHTCSYDAISHNCVI